MSDAGRRGGGGPALLEIEDLRASYGRVEALKGITLSMGEGEWATIVGANGAGKTTLLWAVSGLVAREGAIRLAGSEISRLAPERIVRQGVIQVPQGRQLFGDLTVEDNLMLGAYCHRGRKGKAEVQTRRDEALELFPEVAERLRQVAGTLSGGEQQMVAIARALMSGPRLLLLDEPSTGLAPLVVRRIFEALRLLHDKGLAILLVEQDARLALEASHRGYVMRSGEVVLSGPGAELAASDAVREIYLGASVRPYRGVGTSQEGER
jgi:branched-chain amino acid transport system ATP-binding protein